MRKPDPRMLPDPGQPAELVAASRNGVLALLHSDYLHGDERARGKKQAQACQNVAQLQTWQRTLTKEIKRRQQECAALRQAA